MMDDRRGLVARDDAQFAWSRFRRILWYMNLAAIVAGGATVGLLWLLRGSLPWLFAGLTFAGIYATIVMAAALMGLMFLSNGTGHDEHVVDFLEGEHPLDD